MKQNLFLRFFFINFLFLALCIVFVGIYITSQVEDFSLAQMKRYLSAQTALTAHKVSFEKSPAVFDDTCRHLSALTKARVTLIRADGSVAGDSSMDSKTMENHSDRPEVQAAQLYGEGFSIRKSKSAGADLLYSARRTDDGGFVRLSVPLTELNQSVATLRVKLIAGAAIALLIALAIWGTMTWYIRLLVREVLGFSDALARGKLQQRLMLEDAGEFGAIARNLNAMAKSLGEMVDVNRAELKRINAILKSIPDALVILDSKGEVVLASKEAERLFGISKVIGTRISTIVRDADFLVLIDDAFSRKTLMEREIEFEGFGPRNLLVKAAPLFYDSLSEKPGLVVIFHDVTEVKKLEKVRKNFLANVSHELRTPIASIMGFADTLLGGGLEDKDNSERFVGIIRSNAGRLVTLVEDLSTISGVELGVLRVEPVELGLHELISHVKSNFAARAAEKGITIDVEVDENVRVKADRNRLEQIMGNLVDNAIKYTTQGGVKIGYGLSDGRKCIYVSDTGIGVPQEHVGRLGERFYRVDPSRSREMGGTGLGLAIVKHLVKAHGWTMAVESQQGRGTTVRIFV